MTDTAGNPITMLTGDDVRALEEVWLDGMADESTGNVDSPWGHVFRVHSALVHTDSLGFVTGWRYADEATAERVMAGEATAYAEWCDDEGEV